VRGADARWTNAANWLPNPPKQSPDPPDDVSFTIIATSGPNTGLEQNWTINSITINTTSTFSISDQIDPLTDQILTLRGLYTLTIQSGNITRSQQSGAGKHTINSNIVLGAAGVWDDESVVNPLVLAGSITGPGVIVKTGQGEIDVTQPLGNLCSDGVGLTITNGTLRFKPDAAGTYTFFNDANQAVSIHGGTFGGSGNGNFTWSLTNRILVGSTPNNTIDVTSATNDYNVNPRVNFTGPMTLSGDLRFRSTAGGAQQGYVFDYQGTIALTGGNRTLNFDLPWVGYSAAWWAPSLISGNITQDGVPRRLFFTGTGNNGSLVTLSGDNTGLTGGIELISAQAGSKNNRVRVTSENALGGGGPQSVKIGYGSYLSLAYAFSSATLTMIDHSSTGILGIDHDSSVDIDLSSTGINTDLRIGGVASAVWSGHLTPYGTTYKLGGGGCAPGYGYLGISGVNFFTGARDLDIGRDGIDGHCGIILLSPNNYSGVTRINDDTELVSRVSGTMGTSTIRFVGSGPILRFQVNEQTHANNIEIDNTCPNAQICSETDWRNYFTVAHLTGTISQGDKTLTYTYGGVIALDGSAKTTGTGNTDVQTCLSLGDMGRIAQGNLNLSRNGVIVLGQGTPDTGPSWAQFMAGRLNKYGVGAGAWQLNSGGFAGRGSATVPIIIDNTSPLTTPYGTKTLETVFDGNLALGWAARQGGAYYANAGIDLQQNTKLTDRRYFYVGVTGPGLTGPAASGVVNMISANISGAGTITVGEGGGFSGDGNVGELLLAGHNTWTDSVFTTGYNSGPGGMLVHDAFVRFTSPASLPSGNTGPAYLFAGNPYWFYYGGEHIYSGYLFGGSGGTQTYNLGSSNLILVLGRNAQDATSGTDTGLFGATDGNVTLKNTDVAGMTRALNGNRRLGVLVRDDATLNLGTTGVGGQPVRFIPIDAGLDVDAGAGATTCTPLRDMPLVMGAGGSALATDCPVLTKRGKGLLVLNNVDYTTVDHSLDRSAYFAWRILEGAIRENASGVFGTGAGPDNAKLFFAGDAWPAVPQTQDAVLELAAQNFTRSVGLGAGQVAWEGDIGVGYENGSGGFAAVGADRVVNLGGAGDTIKWGTSGFVKDGVLVFGSPNADHTVDFQNPLDLNNRSCYIRVNDGPAAVEVKLSGTLSNGHLMKYGAGVLELPAGVTYSHNYTRIYEGTLLVNGVIDNSSDYSVFVYTNGTLGGTGTIHRTVFVSNQPGRIDPGSAAQPGKLSMDTLILYQNAKVHFDLGALTATNDSLQVLSANYGLRVYGTAAVEIANLGGLQTGTYSLIYYNGSIAGNVNDLSLATSQVGGFYLNLVNNPTGGSIDLHVTSDGLSTWNVDHDANWCNNANWTAAGMPSFAGSVANFKGKITCPISVAVDGAVTVGQINFDNANAYTLAGASTLTLKSVSSPAGISLASGNHTISAPLSVQSNANVAAGANTLTLTGAQTWANSVTLTVQSGTLTYQISSGATTVGTNDKLVIAPGATVNARGTIDPFSQGTNYVDVENDSAAGLKILSGSKSVGAITGTGKTSVAAGAELSAGSMLQDTLEIQAGGRVTIRATGAGAGDAAASAALDADAALAGGAPWADAAGAAPAPLSVPEPGTLVLILLGGACLAGYAGLLRSPLRQRDMAQPMPTAINRTNVDGSGTAAA